MGMNTEGKGGINEDSPISTLDNCVDEPRDKINTILNVLNLRM